MEPNILLIVLDSVRAINTSLHGYKRETTPNLDKFAENAIVYTQARAPGTGSVQSHTSMFTGLHVAEHQMNGSVRHLKPGHTIWEELSNEGYETGAFSYNSHITQLPLGLADAFDVTRSGARKRLPFPEAADPADLTSSGTDRYIEFLGNAVENNHPIRSLVNGLAIWERTRFLLPDSLQGRSNLPDEIFTDIFTEWVDDVNGPWAACINYMDAHVPYLPRPKHNLWADEEEKDLMREIENPVWEFIGGYRPWSERRELEDLYDGTIHQVDHEVGRIIKYLESREILDDTLVVITADHGEGFGESSKIRSNKSVAHGTAGGIEEGVLHVPLVVSLPNNQGGKRIEDVASLTQFPDVVRSIRDGSSSKDGFVPDDGRVLASALGLSGPERDTAKQWVGNLEEYEPGADVVYQMDNRNRVLKCVRWNGETKGFDCTEAGECKEMSKDCEDTLSAGFSDLSLSSSVKESGMQVDEEIEARLKELGYR